PLPARLVEHPGSEALGVGRPKDRRPARADADPDAMAYAIDHERKPGDSDHHRVPRPDLHKGLRRTGFIPLRGGHELVGAANAPMRTRPLRWRLLSSSRRSIATTSGGLARPKLISTMRSVPPARSVASLTLER